ncbi:MAG: hypothetical protein ACXAC2_00450 [Candidatus Kariarchaeaceae archaeon]|jgi:hypothetical protein
MTLYDTVLAVNGIKEEAIKILGYLDRSYVTEIDHAQHLRLSKIHKRLEKIREDLIK